MINTWTSAAHSIRLTSRPSQKISELSFMHTQTTLRSTQPSWLTQNRVLRGCRNAPSHYSISFGKMTSSSTLTSPTWLSMERGQIWRDLVCRLRYPSQVVQLMYPRDWRCSTPHYHITNVLRACNIDMRALHHIRCSITQDITNTIAHSIIGSRLDYFHVLLFDALVKQ